MNDAAPFELHRQRRLGSSDTESAMDCCTGALEFAK